MVDIEKYTKETTQNSVTVWVSRVEEARALMEEFKKEWGEIFWEIADRENSEGEKEVTLYVLKLTEKGRGFVGS